MITKFLWEDFKYNLKDKKCGVFNYEVETYKMAWILLVSILLTPVSIVLDILVFPIEIMYYLCLRKIRKLRR